MKKALKTVLFLALVGTTGLPRTKDLRLCDRTGQYDTTLWCQLRKHFPYAFLCFLSARSSLCNTLIYEKSTENSAFSYFGGNNRARTCDILLVRQALSQLSYAPTFGDPTEVRTRVTAVKGRCLNHLTIGPYVKVTVYFLVAAVRFEPTTCRV